MRTRATFPTVLASILAGLAVGFGTAGCSRRTFDVKVIEPVASDEIGPATDTGRLSVRFAAMWDEDWQLATFRANTAMAGVLPVRSEIENRSGEAIRMKGVRIVARDAEGREWRRIDAGKARKRIEKFYGIRLRNREGDREYRADFESNSLDTRADLPPGGRRQGLLFFEMPKGVRRQVPVTIVAADDRRN